MSSNLPNINLDQEVIDYINYLRTEHGLKPLQLNELVLLSGAREGKKYEKLKEEYDLPLPTLRQRGSALFKWLSSATPGPKFKKTDFKLAYPQLLALAKEHFALQTSLKASGAVPSGSKEFYGRHKEIERLRELLEEEGAIIVLSGMDGIGRRSLVSHYLQKEQDALAKTEIIWVHSSRKSVIQRSYTLLDVDEKGFARLLQEGKYLFVFEKGESLGDSQGIEFLEQIQYSNNQAIVISTIPLNLSFSTAFLLSGLALEDAMMIVREYGFEGDWWREVVESLGRNPGLLRQYLNWVKTSLGEDQKELILRDTVQFGFISRFFGSLLNSFSEDELALLTFIIQLDNPPFLADILQQYPAQAWMVEDLCCRGIIEKHVFHKRGRVPKSGRKPVFVVPNMIKKYISDKL